MATALDVCDVLVSRLIRISVVEMLFVVVPIAIAETVLVVVVVVVVDVGEVEVVVVEIGLVVARLVSRFHSALKQSTTPLPCACPSRIWSFMNWHD